MGPWCKTWHWYIFKPHLYIQILQLTSLSASSLQRKSRKDSGYLRNTFLSCWGCFSVLSWFVFPHPTPLLASSFLATSKKLWYFVLKYSTHPCFQLNGRLYYIQLTGICITLAWFSVVACLRLVGMVDGFLMIIKFIIRSSLRACIWCAWCWVQINVSK